MARRRKPQDPTYALIEQTVEKSDLNAMPQGRGYGSGKLSGACRHLDAEDEGKPHDSSNGFSKNTVTT